MLHLGLEEPRLDLDVRPGTVGQPVVPVAAARVRAPHEKLAPLEEGVGDVQKPPPLAVYRGHPFVLSLGNVKEEIA